MKCRFRWSIALALGLGSIPESARSQQVPDTLFHPPVAAPAYRPGQGPVVRVDEAHHNFHTAVGRYRPFAQLLERDGYVVQRQRSRFTKGSLDSCRILVIANAISAQNESEWTLPTPSAFDPAEIRAVVDWVRAGGSLLLIADHMPFPGASGELAASFGVLMGNGFAMDAALETGDMMFRRSDGTLGRHPIVQGRNANERVDSLAAFTGHAFRLEAQGAPLLLLGPGTVLLLPEVAWQFSRLTPRLSAAHMLQGAVRRVGRGRLAVFGEAAMFSAQLRGSQRAPTGMNHPRARQNAQFALNVMHWLSGLLPG